MKFLPEWSKATEYLKNLWPRLKGWALAAKTKLAWFFAGPKWRLGLLAAICVLLALFFIDLMLPGAPEKKPPSRPSATPPSATAPRTAEPPEKAAPAPGYQAAPEKETPAKPAPGEKQREEPATPRPQAPVIEAEPEVGMRFVEALIGVLRYELDERSLGWRPNDILVGKFTDNVNNYQLGVLEAVRYTAIRLKEDLTRHGDADAYDPHLVEAVNLLLNRADRFWFPSAESQYHEALAELEAHVENLRTGRSRFIPRGDNMLALMRSYKDLMGNCHRNLVKAAELDGSPVTSSRSDDYFFYAQGVARVFFEMLKVVRVTFKEQITVIDAMPIFNDMVMNLERAVSLDPILIMESDLGGILSNHRANLAAPLSAVLNDMDNLLKYG